MLTLEESQESLKREVARVIDENKNRVPNFSYVFGYGNIIMLASGNYMVHGIEMSYDEIAELLGWVDYEKK